MIVHYFINIECSFTSSYYVYSLTDNWCFFNTIQKLSTIGICYCLILTLMSLKKLNNCKLVLTLISTLYILHEYMQQQQKRNMSELRRNCMVNSNIIIPSCVKLRDEYDRNFIHLPKISVCLTFLSLGWTYLTFFFQKINTCGFLLNDLEYHFYIGIILICVKCR